MAPLCLISPPLLKHLGTPLLSAVIVTHNVGLCNGNGSDSITTKIALATRVCKCFCLFVADESGHVKSATKYAYMPF